MMRKIILASLVLVLMIVGCTGKIPETNPPIGEATCVNCQSKCQGADGTGCVDGKCECYYDETDKENNKEKNDQPDFNKNIINIVENLPSCGDRMDFLNVSPLNYNDFQTIIPLGNIGGPYGHRFPTDHLYFTNEIANTPLYMPGDALITEISVTEYLLENPPFKDYVLVFYLCKELSIKFAHIGSLSDELLSKFNAASTNCKEYEAGIKKYKTCSDKNLNITINSGQQIGNVGLNHPKQMGLDVWATDFRAKEAKYANPVRWPRDIKYITCPLDYFIGKEKEKLYSLLGDFDNNKRIIEPLCGTIEQDVKGTAQGIWFVEGTENTYPEEPHLALVLDNVDPRINVFSVGMSIPNLETNKYLFSPKLNGEVNIAFSKVKPGTIYCYEQTDWDFVIVLELLNETTLKIEKQTGSKCSKPFKFISGVVFER